MNKTEKQMRFLPISLKVFNAELDFNLLQINGFLFSTHTVVRIVLVKWYNPFSYCLSHCELLFKKQFANKSILTDSYP